MYVSILYLEVFMYSWHQWASEFDCLSPSVCSHILKVPFENSGGSGIVYIWIGNQATQEEAIHAEQMGRTMFEVGDVMMTYND